MTICVAMETPEGTWLGCDSACVEAGGGAMMQVASIENKMHVLPHLDLAFVAAGSVAMLTRVRIVLDSIRRAPKTVYGLMQRILSHDLGLEANEHQTTLLVAFRGELYTMDFPLGEVTKPRLETLVTTGMGTPWAQGIAQVTMLEKLTTEEYLATILGGVCDVPAPGCARPTELKFFPKD